MILLAETLPSRSRIGEIGGLIGQRGIDIGNEEHGPAARTQDTAHLTHCACVVRDMLEHVIAHDGVDRCVVERQGGHIERLGAELGMKIACEVADARNLPEPNGEHGFRGNVDNAHVRTQQLVMHVEV